MVCEAVRNGRAAVGPKRHPSLAPRPHAAAQKLADDRQAAVDLMGHMETARGMQATGKKRCKSKAAPQPAANQQPLPGTQLPTKAKRGRPSKAVLAAREAAKAAARGGAEVPDGV